MDVGRVVSDIAQSLLAPSSLWSADEALALPCQIPNDSGIYAWYFKDVPPGVPTDKCHRFNGKTLLYVGIAPRATPKNGKPASSQRLRHRIRYHYQGNAEGSTLRLTLGCLLATSLEVQLHRVGSGTRLTFADGEAVLSRWMRENAFVTWHAHPQPWLAEKAIIERVCLPLNLDMNRAHPFHPLLSSLRREAKASARQRPIWVASK